MANKEKEGIDFWIICLSFILLMIHTLTFLQNYYSFVITCSLYTIIIIFFLLKRSCTINTKAFLSLACVLLAIVLMMIVSLVKEYSISTLWGKYFPYIIWGSLYFLIEPLFDEKSRKYFIGLFLIIMAIGVVSTLIVVIVDNNAARLLAGSATVEERENYYKQGVGGYGFIYGCVFLFYAMLIWAKDIHGIGKLFTILLSITTFIMLLFASYTIAFLFSLIIILLFLYATSKRRLSIALFFTVFALIFLLRVPILEGLQNIATQLELYWIENRIGQLIDSSVTGNITELRRYELYSASWVSFISNPLIGGDSIGGHSMLFDILGEFGVFGLFFFICNFILLLRISTQLPSRKNIIYILFFIFMCIDTIDTIVLLPIVYFVLPIILKTKKNENYIVKY